MPLFLKRNAICSQLLFCKERHERFAHGCSFFKSDESWSGSAKHWLPGLVRISKTLVARAGLRRIGSRPDPLSQPAMIIPITGLLGHYAKPPAPHAGAGRGGIPSHGLESSKL